MPLVFCEKYKLRVNCWQSLKPLQPQHKDETRLSAMVTKVEKNVKDIHKVKS